MNYQAWFEKYRPKDIDSIILPNEDIATTLNLFYDNEFVQGNMLSYGPAGFGKTSVSEIMIHKIIKSREDLFILGRKTDDVEELKRWLQQRPVHSKQKIVKIEEMDRLSQQAQTVLKDGLMEKFQNNCAFLATTNKPEKLDPALLTRFNTKINFKEIEASAAVHRIKFILDSEKIEYNTEEVQQFVNQYIKRGMRDMINNLELASVGGKFIPSKIQSFIGVSDNEENITKYIIYLMQYTSTKTPQEILNLIKDAKSDEHFWTYYEYILKLFKFDLRLSYDYIYDTLINSELDLSSKNIAIEHYQDLDIKRFKSLHTIHMINQMMIGLYRYNGGSIVEIGSIPSEI